MSAPGFRAILAPRLTALEMELLDRIAAEPLPPRVFEWVFVQSRGMRHHLTLRFADRFGCAGSLKLPFPRDLITNAARWANVRLEGSEQFTRDAMLWRIEHRLRSLDTGDPTFEPLRTYLGHPDPRMRAGLAARIADRFDDYQLFRPELLAAWEHGTTLTDSLHEGWQAALWRELALADAATPARVAERALAGLRTAEPGTLAIPARLTVFGVSALPERFIEFLEALSRHSEVTLYAALLPASTDHPLVRTWGTQGAAMQQLLEAHGATIEHLGPATFPTVPLTARVQCHSTHGVLREVEVIRDQLLDAFATDSSLRPEDILVLVPDVESWGPTVETVFSAEEPGAPRIPIHIADQTLRSDAAISAFAVLLALEGGRLAHSELFAALQHPMVRTAAELDEEAVESLGHRTHDANVRWGYDAASLAALGLPTSAMPTWREGLDRLLMGIVVGAADQPTLDVLPAAGATAGDPDAIARLDVWVGRVAAALADWRRPRPLAEWSVALTQTAEWYLTGFDTDSTSSRARLLAHLRRIASDHPAAADRDPTPIAFSVIREWLEHTWSEDGGSSHFRTGSVTVAAMKPMRSIPFRVIAVAGLDDATFPRRDRPVSFDLISHTRRAGDRSLREDDRQLFLDLMLAAEDRLILTWSGREAATHAVRACSVVIDELRDHHDRMGTPLPVIEHPLHPCSPRYLSSEPADASLFTFAHTMARAATTPRTASDAFAPRPVDPAVLPPRTEEIRLEDLLKCWENPAKWFCERTLQLRLPVSDADQADHERFAVDSLQAGLIRSLIVQRALRGDGSAESQQRHLLADGDLPPGALGEAIYAKLEREVADVAAVARSLRTSAAAIFIQGDGWSIRGTLDGIVDGKRVIVRGGDFHPKNRIRAWIEHVVLCAAAQSGQPVPRQTELIGIGAKAKRAAKRAGGVKVSTCVLSEVPNAITMLGRWVAVLRDARTQPLPFFAQAGAAWLDDRWQEADTSPIEAAHKAYRGSDFHEGDERDPYIALCFRDQDPVKERQAHFEQLANTLCPDVDLPSLP